MLGHDDAGDVVGEPGALPVALPGVAVLAVAQRLHGSPQQVIAGDDLTSADKLALRRVRDLGHDDARALQLAPGRYRQLPALAQEHLSHHSPPVSSRRCCSVHGSARPSPSRRGTTWTCRWKTVCVASAPAEVMKFASVRSMSVARIEANRMARASCGGPSSASRTCLRGTTRKCPGVTGLSGWNPTE